MGGGGQRWEDGFVCTGTLRPKRCSGLGMGGLEGLLLGT